MPLKLQVVLIPVDLPDMSTASVAARKFLHLTSPQNTLGEVCDALLKRYYRLYPEAETLELDGIQDKDCCDLDPDFVAEDVFVSGDILRVLVRNSFAALSRDTTILPSGILDVSSASVKRGASASSEAELSRFSKRSRTIWAARQDSSFAEESNNTQISGSAAAKRGISVSRGPDATQRTEVNNVASSPVHLPPPETAELSAIIPRKRTSPQSAKGTRITSGMLVVPASAEKPASKSIFSDNDDTDMDTGYGTFAQFARQAEGTLAKDGKNDHIGSNDSNANNGGIVAANGVNTSNMVNAGHAADLSSDSSVVITQSPEKNQSSTENEKTQSIPPTALPQSTRQTAQASPDSEHNLQAKIQQQVPQKVNLPAPVRKPVSPSSIASSSLSLPPPESTIGKTPSKSPFSSQFATSTPQQPLPEPRLPFLRQSTAWPTHGHIPAQRLEPLTGSTASQEQAFSKDSVSKELPSEVPISKASIAKAQPSNEQPSKSHPNDSAELVQNRSGVHVSTPQVTETPASVPSAVTSDAAKTSSAPEVDTSENVLRKSGAENEPNPKNGVLPPTPVAHRGNSVGSNSSDGEGPLSLIDGHVPSGEVTAIPIAPPETPVHAPTALEVTTSKTTTPSSAPDRTVARGLSKAKETAKRYKSTVGQITQRNGVLAEASSNLPVSHQNTAATSASATETTEKGRPFLTKSQILKLRRAGPMPSPDLRENLSMPIPDGSLDSSSEERSKPSVAFAQHLQERQRAAKAGSSNVMERQTRSRTSIAVAPTLEDLDSAALERSEKEMDLRAKELPHPFNEFTSKAKLSSDYIKLTKLDAKLDRRSAERLEISKTVKTEDRENGPSVSSQRNSSPAPESNSSVAKESPPYVVMDDAVESPDKSDAQDIDMDEDVSSQSESDDSVTNFENEPPKSGKEDSSYEPPTESEGREATLFVDHEAEDDDTTPAESVDVAQNGGVDPSNGEKSKSQHEQTTLQNAEDESEESSSSESSQAEVESETRPVRPEPAKFIFRKGSVSGRPHMRSVFRKRTQKELEGADVISLDSSSESESESEGEREGASSAAAEAPSDLKDRSRSKSAVTDDNSVDDEPVQEVPVKRKSVTIEASEDESSSSEESSSGESGSEESGSEESGSEESGSESSSEGESDNEETPGTQALPESTPSASGATKEPKESNPSAKEEGSAPSDSSSESPGASTTTSHSSTETRDKQGGSVPPDSGDQPTPSANSLGRALSGFSKGIFSSALEKLETLGGTDEADRNPVSPISTKRPSDGIEVSANKKAKVDTAETSGSRTQSDSMPASQDGDLKTDPVSSQKSQETLISSERKEDTSLPTTLSSANGQRTADVPVLVSENKASETSSGEGSESASQTPSTTSQSTSDEESHEPSTTKVTKTSNIGTAEQVNSQEVEHSTDANKDTPATAAPSVPQPPAESEEVSSSSSDSDSDSISESSSESDSEEPVDASAPAKNTRPLVPLKSATKSVGRLLPKNHKPGIGKTLSFISAPQIQQNEVSSSSAAPSPTPATRPAPTPVVNKTSKGYAPIKKPSLARLTDLSSRGVPQVLEKQAAVKLDKPAITVVPNDSSDSDDSDSSSSSGSDSDSNSDSSDGGGSGFMTLKSINKPKKKKAKSSGGFSSLMKDAKKK